MGLTKEYSRGDQVTEEFSWLIIRYIWVYWMNKIMSPKSTTCNRKTQQAPSSQSTDKDQAHKSASSRSFIGNNPVTSAHHTACPQVPIGGTKEELYKEIENVALDSSTLAVDVAELVHRNENDTGNRHNGSHLRMLSQ
jgi:hypothetical protein